MSVSNKAYSFLLVDCNGEQWGFESDHLWTVGCYTPSNHCGVIQEAYSKAWSKSSRSGKTESYSLVATCNKTKQVVHEAMQLVKA